MLAGKWELRIRGCHSSYQGSFIISHIAKAATALEGVAETRRAIGCYWPVLVAALFAPALVPGGPVRLSLRAGAFPF